MNEERPQLEWFEIQWRWVFGALFFSALAKGLADLLVVDRLPEIFADALASSASIAAFVLIFQFHGNRARWKMALRQSVLLFLLWTPFSVLAHWVFQAIENAAA